MLLSGITIFCASPAYLREQTKRKRSMKIKKTCVTSFRELRMQAASRRTSRRPQKRGGIRGHVCRSLHEQQSKPFRTDHEYSDHKQKKHVPRHRDNWSRKKWSKFSLTHSCSPVSLMASSDEPSCEPIGSARKHSLTRKPSLIPRCIVCRSYFLYAKHLFQHGAVRNFQNRVILVSVRELSFYPSSSRLQIPLVQLTLPQRLVKESLFAWHPSALRSSPASPETLVLFWCSLGPRDPAKPP
jgi:hypothetical protein